MFLSQKNSKGFLLNFRNRKKLFMMTISVKHNKIGGHVLCPTKIQKNFLLTSGHEKCLKAFFLLTISVQQHNTGGHVFYAIKRI